MDTLAISSEKVLNSKKYAKQYAKQVEKENAEIIAKLNEIESLIDTTNNIFDYITDYELIDGLIYELNALNKKYSYYVKICKERGITNPL